MAARMQKRADGRYVVTVTYEDGEGAKRRHFVYGKTQTEANAKAKAARERLDAGAPVRDASAKTTAFMPVLRRIGPCLLAQPRQLATTHSTPVPDRCLAGAVGQTSWVPL